MLLLCWRVKQRAPAIGVAFALYALTTCYILLFGSGTERNTYAMMGPIIGLLAASARNTEDLPLLGFTALLTVITLSSNTLKHAYPGTVLTMVKPLVCVVLFVFVSWLAIRVAPLPAGEHRSVTSG